MPLSVTVVPCLSDNYGYILRDQATGATASVDAPEAAPLIAALETKGWGLDMVLVTHHHYDHTDGVDELRAKYGAKVVGHAADAERLPKLDLAVSEGDEVALGESRAKVIDVSGHTIGHIAYLFDGHAFTADSLMALGCGRVFEGTHHQMWESLSKFLTLPPETLIYSGHNYGQANGRFALSIEPDNADLQDRIARIKAADAAGEPICPVSLGEELKTNPFLRATEESVKQAVGLPGGDDAVVFAEVRRRKDSF